jgi:hypothetical protein
MRDSVHRTLNCELNNGCEKHRQGLAVIAAKVNDIAGVRARRGLVGAAEYKS